VQQALSVKPARPEELRAAFGLVFQHVSADEQATRVGNALNLVGRGELDPAGVLVVRDGRQLLGALICLPVPGASALLWPPQAVDGSDEEAVKDQLVRHASSWLQQRGAKLGQALLLPDETHLAVALERNGFTHITSLWYMRHNLELSSNFLSAREQLTYQTFDHTNPAPFQDTLARTYVETQDCPEVNGVRGLDEIVEGHRAQGSHNEERWWLALASGQPVGVLLLTEVPEWGGWDVSYVGVVPEARRRGFGRELMHKALFEARAAEIAHLTLSVDARNQPAWELYRHLGFEPFDRREVYLAIWSK